MLKATELNLSGKSHHSALTTPSWRAGPPIGRQANKSWWPGEVTTQDTTNVRARGKKQDVAYYKITSVTTRITSLLFIKVHKLRVRITRLQSPEDL